MSIELALVLWLAVVVLIVAFIYGASERRDPLRDEVDAERTLYPRERLGDWS